MLKLMPRHKYLGVELIETSNADITLLNQQACLRQANIGRKILYTLRFFLV